MTNKSIPNLAAATTPLAGTEKFPLWDGTKTAWSLITSIGPALKAYFDTLYPSGSGTSTGTNTGDTTFGGDFVGGGSYSRIKTYTTIAGTTNLFSVALGSFTQRVVKVSVLLKVSSGANGTRFEYRESVLYETGGAALAEVNLVTNTASGGNMNLTFTTAAATLTVTGTSSFAGESGAAVITVQTADTVTVTTL